MNRNELQSGTNEFTINVIRFSELLPKTIAGNKRARPVIRSAGSVGPNYSTSASAKSKADFIHKIEILVEEADESHYWLEIIRDTNMKTGEVVNSLIKEASELTPIFAATDKTAKFNSEKV